MTNEKEKEIETIYSEIDNTNESKYDKDNSKTNYKNPKEAIIEQETEMMEDMTEGQLAEYLADNFSDY